MTASQSGELWSRPNPARLQKDPVTAGGVSIRAIEELREQKHLLELQVEALQTRVHGVSSSLKQRDQEVEVSVGSRALQGPA